MSLVSHLMRQNSWSFTRALSVAKKIEQERKESAAKKKAVLERAQGVLDFAASGPCEEPADRFVVTDATVDF